MPKIEEIIKDALVDKFPSVLNKQNVKLEHRLIGDEGDKSPKSDIFIELSNKVIAIEVELKQARPEPNYVKYLRWMKKCKVRKHVYLIHIFSPWFGSGEKDSRIQNIHYLRNKIKPNWLTYKPLYYSNKFEMEEFRRFGGNVKEQVISDIVRNLDFLSRSYCALPN